jgi:hypothetical protein
MSNSNQILVKSPLALSGVFISILRERFKVGNGLAWEYHTGEAGRQTGSLLIEAGSNPLSEERSVRPAIYVIRNPIAYKQAIVGDLNSVQHRSQAKVYYATAETSFTFTVESNEEGEAAQISDHVLCTLMMGSDIIERTFGFRKLGPFALSAVSKPTHDQPIAQIHVSMGLTFDVRWGTIPIAPILNEIVVNYKNTTYNSSEDYFSEIYAGSFRHRD